VIFVYDLWPRIGMKCLGQNVIRFRFSSSLSKSLDCSTPGAIKYSCHLLVFGCLSLISTITSSFVEPTAKSEDMIETRNRR